MARLEQDREDLLAEAKALVERIELRLTGNADPVVAGFRRNGAASVYFGADPVWHFNAMRELRRAYVAGRLIAAEKRRLKSLTRHRAPGEVQLLRHDLSDEETSRLVAECSERLQTLRQAIDAGAYQVVGVVGLEPDVIDRLRSWLNALPRSLRVADSPRVG